MGQPEPGESFINEIGLLIKHQPPLPVKLTKMQNSQYPSTVFLRKATSLNLSSLLSMLIKKRKHYFLPSRCQLAPLFFVRVHNLQLSLYYFYCAIITLNIIIHMFCISASARVH